MRLPITIVIQPSRQLVLLLSVAHALAMAVVLLLVLPWPARLALLALPAISLWRVLVRLRRQPLLELYLGAKGELKVGTGGTATLLPETAVLPGITLLAVRCDGKRHTHVLLPDAFPHPEDCRRLRVWLKTSAGV